MWLWLRRTWWWLLPTLAAAQIFAMLAANRDLPDGSHVYPSWSIDWSWMMSVNSGATLLLSPTAAAATTYLLTREWPEGIHGLAKATLRPSMPTLHIVGAVVCLAWLVQAVGLAGGSLLCWTQGAATVGLTVPWQALTGPAAVLAASAAGALVGVLYQSLWSVPGVAIVLFVGHRLFIDLPYPELFTIEMATWYTWEARPAPLHLMATIVVNLLIAAALLSVAAWQAWPQRRRPASLIVTAVAAVVGSVAVASPYLVGMIDSTYESLP